ncbi:MAG: HPr(Ser) kinase/phosphatase [Desulfuromonadaceae bacterium]|nr:HPr(Ser) kinase/phosphatase [Desulfuromonas sp.]MDY0184685.1 HPr(Ser) kinase/phosphatase [Desulfuromonadaceae bacterium]
MNKLSVKRLLAEKDTGLELELVSGADGLDREIESHRIQKPGLALAGHLNFLHPSRVQILGSTELSFLATLPEEVAEHNVEQFCALGFSCMIVTKGQLIPAVLLEKTRKYSIPLLRTQLQSSTLISLISRFLEERLLPGTSVHGVLVDVFGVGVLLMGKSGIGKSECALDLVLRGHRLVADDVVKVRIKLPAVLFGEGSDLLHYHMEIRGLGIINIKHLFGVSAIRERKKIDVVIKLTEWQNGEQYDRLGIDDQYFELLGIKIPLLKVPVCSGRNISSIIEVAARNQLLKEMGYNSAREFQDRLEKRMAEAAQQHSHNIIGDNLE